MPPMVARRGTIEPMRWLAIVPVLGCGFRGPAQHADANEPVQPDAALDAPAPDAPEVPLVLVQHQSGTGSRTASLPLQQVQTAHDLIVAVVALQQDPTSDLQIASVSDTLGDTFTPIVPMMTFSDLSQAIYVATDVRGGTNTVHATLDQSYNVELRVYEYSGLATTSPVDATSTGMGTAQVATTTALATMHPHDLLFGAITVDPGSSVSMPGTARTWRRFTVTGAMEFVRRWFFTTDPTKPQHC